MKVMKENKFLLVWGAIVLIAVGALFSSPFWAWGTSTYTGKLGLEMPERGDVGWDDAIRLNHKLQEVALMPVLEGNLVYSGLTVSGTTTVVTWDAGWINLSGVSYYVPSGATTIANNTINWLSAVTPGVASGATIQVRTTEYDLPSGASGFAHVPLYALTVEAGNIVRAVDLRYMHKDRDGAGQDLTSGATPVFQGLRVRDMVDASKLNASAGVTGPSGTSPTALPSGGLYTDTNSRNLEVGISGVNYAVPLEWVEDVIIMSPDLLDNPNQIPLFTVPSGATCYLSGATFWSDTSGVTVEGIVYSATDVNLQFGAGTTIFNFCTLAAPSGGVSVWQKAYTGTTVIPPGRTVMMDFGVSTPGYIRARFVGRLVGAKP